MGAQPSLSHPWCPLQYRRVKPMGAPGLAFETWDPSNQFPLETPTLLFVIRSVAEGPAVPRTFRGNECGTAEAVPFVERRFPIGKAPQVKLVLSALSKGETDG